MKYLTLQIKNNMNLNLVKNFLKITLSLTLMVTHNLNASTLNNSGELANLKVHTAPIKLPLIEFHDQNGKKINNEIFKGKISVINLWATWCPPCVRELPQFDNLVTQLKGTNISIFAISQDKAGTKIVPPYFKKLNIRNLQIYVDHQSTLMKVLKTPVLPTTIIIDKNGMEIARLVGEIKWDSKEVISYLKSLDKN
jgi:thiol-disulfide isomerase/thioredoxin